MWLWLWLLWRVCCVCCLLFVCVCCVFRFPLVSCGPGIVATLCAIVFYKEIQGARNYALLAAAAAVTIVGVVLIAFSLPAGS